MLQMMNGFIWHLTSDSALTTGSKEAQNVFSTFMEQGETAITGASYFGAVIPGHLCANFAYHFAVVASWPMCINPLTEPILPPLVSEGALDYEPMMTDLYAATHPPLCLITRDAQLMVDHCRQTPRHLAPDTPFSNWCSQSQLAYSY
jgi:hypothetical protein